MFTECIFQRRIREVSIVNILNEIGDSVRKNYDLTETEENFLYIKDRETGNLFKITVTTVGTENKVHEMPGDANVSRFYPTFVDAVRSDQQFLHLQYLTVQEKGYIELCVDIAGDLKDYIDLNWEPTEDVHYSYYCQWYPEKDIIRFFVLVGSEEKPVCLSEEEILIFRKLVRVEINRMYHIPPEQFWKNRKDYLDLCETDTATLEWCRQAADAFSRNVNPENWDGNGSMPETYLLDNQIKFQAGNKSVLLRATKSLVEYIYEICDEKGEQEDFFPLPYCQEDLARGIWSYFHGRELQGKTYCVGPVTKEEFDIMNEEGFKLAATIPLDEVLSYTQDGLKAELIRRAVRGFELENVYYQAVSVYKGKLLIGIEGSVKE